MSKLWMNCCRWFAGILHSWLRWICCSGLSAVDWLLIFLFGSVAVGWSLWVSRCGLVVMGQSLWISYYGSGTVDRPFRGQLLWVGCCRLVVVGTSSSGTVAGVRSLWVDRLGTVAMDWLLWVACSVTVYVPSRVVQWVCCPLCMFLCYSCYSSGTSLFVMFTPCASLLYSYTPSHVFPSLCMSLYVYVAPCACSLCWN